MSNWEPAGSRRVFLQGLGGLAAGLAAWPIAAAEPAGGIDNPYAGVDWDSVETLHSMSHQHQGQSAASLDLFWSMGYRHLAFSNYYPSAPTKLLPDWLAEHPEALECPNAEHHSFTDSFTHCNGLGSLTATGAGWMSGFDRSQAPLVHTFRGTVPFREARPWESIYRLDLGLAGQADQTPAATLTVTGGRACGRDGTPLDNGVVNRLAWDAKRASILLRADEPELHVTVDYDPATTRIGQFRLMQGSNRPWRDVFSSCLDGELVDGQRVGGLQFPEGGGMTINHPSSTRLDHFLELLDYDERVLGIEVFNHLTSGFGRSDGFYGKPSDPATHFYQLWDQILGTGRRCLGFFVKDHQSCATGRNVLLVPPGAGRSVTDRQRDALVAYRRGAFFGCLGAIAVDESGATVPPFDLTDFRFTRIELVANASGQPAWLDVAVDGHDRDRRPNVHLRFVTEAGVVALSDAPSGRARLPLRWNGELPRFVRVEAVALPAEIGGRRYGPDQLAGLNVQQLWQLHDQTLSAGVFGRGGGQPGEWPIPVCDLLFSQPIRFGVRPGQLGER